MILASVGFTQAGPLILCGKHIHSAEMVPHTQQTSESEVSIMCLCSYVRPVTQQYTSRTVQKALL